MEIKLHSDREQLIYFLIQFDHFSDINLVFLNLPHQHRSPAASASPRPLILRLLPLLPQFLHFSIQLRIPSLFYFLDHHLRNLILWQVRNLNLPLNLILQLRHCPLLPGVAVGESGVVAVVQDDVKEFGRLHDFLPQGLGFCCPFAVFEGIEIVSQGLESINYFGYPLVVNSDIAIRLLGYTSTYLPPQALIPDLNLIKLLRFDELVGS